MERNQKTLKLYPEKGKRKEKSCALNTLGSSLAEVPRRCPRNAGAGGATWRGCRHWGSPARAWTLDTETIPAVPQAARDQLPHTADWSFQVEKKNTMTTLSEQESAQGPPLPGSFLNPVPGGAACPLAVCRPVRPLGTASDPSPARTGPSGRSPIHPGCHSTSRHLHLIQPSLRNSRPSAAYLPSPRPT